MVQQLSREVRKLAGAFLTFTLSGPLAAVHLVLSASARGGLDERTAIETGILLGAGYVGFLITKGFVLALLAVSERLLTDEDREFLAKREHEKIPTGFYISALCLFASFTYFAATALLLILQPGYGAVAVGWLILGVILFLIWATWVFWPDEPTAAVKVEGEYRVVTNARKIPGRLWEPA